MPRPEFENTRLEATRGVHNCLEKSIRQLGNFADVVEVLDRPGRIAQPDVKIYGVSGRVLAAAHDEFDVPAAKARLHVIPKSTASRRAVSACLISHRLPPPPSDESLLWMNCNPVHPIIKDVSRGEFHPSSNRMREIHYDVGGIPQGLAQSSRERAQPLTQSEGGRG